MQHVLKAFMVELATDPRRLAAYLSDRESYLAATGLPPEACEALLTGDQERVAKLVGAVLGRHTIVMAKQKTSKRKKKSGRRRKVAGKTTRRKRG